MAQVQAEVANTEVMTTNGHAHADNAPAETTNTAVNRLEAGSEMKADVSSVSVVPDGGWGWMVVLGTFMVHLINDGVEYSFGIFVEDFVDYFESSRSAVGGIGSLMLGMTYCSGPIVSVLTNKFGCRSVTIAGSVVAALGFILSRWSPNIWFMYFSFGFVTGLGVGIAFVPSIVAVSFYFEKRRSIAVGIAVCGTGIGTFAIAPLTNALLSEYTWKGTVLVEAGILLNCILSGMLYRPLTISNKSHPEKVTITKVVGAEQSGMGDQSASSHELPQMSATQPEPQSDKNRSAKIDNTKEEEEIPTDVSASGQSRVEVGSTSGLELPQIAASSSVDVQRSESEKSRTAASTMTQNHEVIDGVPQYRPERSTTSLKEQPELQSDNSSSPAKIGDTKTMRQRMPETVIFKLFSDSVFVLFAVSTLVTGIGFVVPYVFLPNRGLRLGFDNNQSSWLMAVVGISNTIGRVVFGFIAGIKHVNPVMLYSTMLVVCGICSVFSSLMRTFPLQMCYAFCFGFFSCVYMSLKPVVVVDLLGREKFCIAFGFVVLFQGIGAMIGPPLAGWLFDVSNSYDNSFYMTGVCLIVSGLMLFPIPCIQRRRRSHSHIVTGSQSPRVGPSTAPDSPGPCRNLPDASSVPDSHGIDQDINVNVEITRL